MLSKVPIDELTKTDLTLLISKINATQIKGIDDHDDALLISMLLRSTSNIFKAVIASENEIVTNDDDIIIAAGDFFLILVRMFEELNINQSSFINTFIWGQQPQIVSKPTHETLSALSYYVDEVNYQLEIGQLSPYLHYMTVIAVDNLKKLINDFGSSFVDAITRSIALNS